MSIFKSTFKAFICRQLNARQDLISTESGIKRQNEFIQYTTAKNSWVRMQSFVDYDSPDGRYKGADLAKKYVLESGALFHRENTLPDQFSLRGGFANRMGSYGGDLGNRDYGIVPMPGITSVKVKNKSAYGSLREAVIEFDCHDKKQLDDMEILYMRPGFPILLEWGWSLYLDTFVNGEDYKKDPDVNSVKFRMDLSNLKIKNFDGGGINPFAEGLTQESIYQRIEFLQHKYSGNYEGMLGFVRNFSWKLNKNGGFKCTTTLISIGEILDSLKMNSVDNSVDNGGLTKTVMSDFQKLITDGELYIGGYHEFDDLYNNPYVDHRRYTLKLDGYNLSKQYIQLGFLLGILNKKSNLFDQNGNGIVNIELPFPINSNKSQGLCLASDDSISIDPEVCIIKNPKATFVTGEDAGFDLFKKAKRISVTQRNDGAVFYYENTENVIIKDFIDPDTGNGIIGNIYVSIDKVMEIYDQISVGDKGYVSITKFINQILSEISFSLGSINNFDIFTDNNTISIIDKFYLESSDKSRKENKFKFNILGKNSILREFNIESKIFPSQATMIAIAAQSRQNLGAIQTSTNNYLNKGVQNRLIKDLTDSINKGNPYSVIEAKNEKSDLISKIINLRQYIIEYIYQGKEGNKQAANEYLNTLINKINVDTNYKAIIPISLRFDIDGIGGGVIGNIFTVNKDVLPSDYADKNIGFIITGIEHTIEKSDWITSYNTQICLLYDDNLKAEIERFKIDKESVSQEVKAEIESTFTNTLEQIQAFQKLVYFIMDYYSGDLLFDIDGKSGNFVASVIIENKRFQDDYSSFYPDVIPAINDIILMKKQIEVVIFDRKYIIPGKLVGLPIDASVPLEKMIKGDNDWYNILKTNPSLKDEFDSQFEILKQKSAKISQKNYLISKTTDRFGVVAVSVDNIPDDDKIVTFSIPQTNTDANSVTGKISDSRFGVAINIGKFDLKTIQKLILS